MTTQTLSIDEILEAHMMWLKSGKLESSRADIHDDKLRSTDLTSVGLSHADLRGADLRGANLCDTIIWGADLRGAHLDISICEVFSLWHIKFTADALPWLILHPD